MSTKCNTQTLSCVVAACAVAGQALLLLHGAQEQVCMTFLIMCLPQGMNGVWQARCESDGITEVHIVPCSSERLAEVHFLGPLSTVGCVNLCDSCFCASCLQYPLLLCADNVCAELLSTALHRRPSGAPFAFDIPLPATDVLHRRTADPFPTTDFVLSTSLIPTTSLLRTTGFIPRLWSPLHRRPGEYSLQHCRGAKGSGAA